MTRVDFGRAGKPTPHGTENGYRRYGCRCDDCRHEHARYNRERYLIRVAPVKEPRPRTAPTSLPHTRVAVPPDEARSRAKIPWKGLTDERFCLLWEQTNGSPFQIKRRVRACIPTIYARASRLGLRRYPYLTLKDAACRLGCARSTLRRLIHKGELPAVLRNPRAAPNTHRWWITESAVRDIARRLPALLTRFPPPPRGYLTSPEATSLFHMSRSGFEYWCRSGHIQAVQTVRPPGLRQWLIPIDQPRIQVALARGNATASKGRKT